MPANGDVNAILAERGLLIVAKHAGWQPTALKNGRPGWSYPVYNVHGQAYAQKRWKSADGEAPKYLWLPNQPATAKYYFLPGTFSEVQAQNGTCYLAGGEPDVLAYHAAGIRNAICWLNGEGSPPATLAENLARMGVTRLVYAPDRDLAGMQSAAKVAKLLHGSGIELVLLELPGEVGSKQDINDLWLASDFVPAQFAERLRSLPLLNPVDVYLYEKETGKPAIEAVRHVSDRIEAWRNEWVEGIIAALGTPAKVENGHPRWHCPLPHHEDRHPSFSYTDRQRPGFYWPVCTCGIQDRKDAWEVVAAALNLDTWDEYRAVKAAGLGYAPGPSRVTMDQAPNDSPQLPTEAPRWVDMHDVLQDLRRELAGEVRIDMRPVPFPLRSLHPFGGFARFMRRKKLVAVTGVSGGGKTLLLQTMMIALMQEGYDVIWWGPEWDPYEYAEQMLQRLDGLAMDRLDEWRLWRHYEDLGVIAEMSARYGLSRVSEAAIQRAISKVDEALAMPGRMYVIPDLSLALDAVCDIAIGISRIKRAEGRDVAAFAFDYIQLAQLGGAHDWTWAERVVHQVKTMCGAADLCGFVSSQVRKKDSEASRDGVQLTQGSAQGLSDAQFNLYLTLTPEFDGEGNMGKTSTLSVAKNSRGRKGKIQVYADYEHLLVIDKPVSVRAVPDITAAPAIPAPLDLGGSRG